MTTEYHKAWLAKPGNKEKAREATRKWKAGHPIESRLYKKAWLTKTRGVRINKKEIINWDSRICGICSLLIEGEHHIDHIVPLSRGGKHEVTNLQLAHPYCNRSKFTKLPEEMKVIL